MREEERHDPDALQRDIAARRADLVAALHEAEAMVRHKLDLRGHARRRLERAKVKTRDVVAQGRDLLRERRPLVVGLTAAAGLLGAAGLVAAILRNRKLQTEREDQQLFQGEDDLYVEGIHASSTERDACTCPCHGGAGAGV
jgi:hypothetical protein